MTYQIGKASDGYYTGYAGGNYTNASARYSNGLLYAPGSKYGYTLQSATGAYASTAARAATQNGYQANNQSSYVVPIALGVGALSYLWWLGFL